MKSPPARPYVLEICESLVPVSSHVESTVLRVVLLTGGMTLLSVVLVVLLGRILIAQPLQRLIEKARAVGAGDYSTPVVVRGRDELTELASTLNAMSDQIAQNQERIRQETEARIAALEQLRHEDRLQTVGRLASGVAHELGTPLNVVSGRAGLIASRKLSDEEVVSSAEIIRTQADRITKLVQQLLDFARRSRPARALVDLRQLLHQTLDMMTPLAKSQRATVTIGNDTEAVVGVVDAGKIQQVLTNLLINAFQSMPRGGNIRVSISRERCQHPHDIGTGEAKDFLRIDVEDEGEGIAPKDLDHIFEPFFTTKDVGKGSGLGLSIAYGIIQEHGGWISVDSRVGVGSRFSVHLPGRETDAPKDSRS